MRYQSGGLAKSHYSPEQMEALIAGAKSSRLEIAERKRIQAKNLQMENEKFAKQLGNDNGALYLSDKHISSRF